MEVKPVNTFLPPNESSGGNTYSTILIGLGIVIISSALLCAVIKKIEREEKEEKDEKNVRIE